MNTELRAEQSDDGPTTAPIVSVVMGVYNGGEYLREAIDSILAQTFTDFEFIIIDDGSEDGTPDLLDSLRDYRVRVVHQANAGLTVSLNRGLHLSNGKYIARMDADDAAAPTRFERQVAFLDERQEVGALGTFCTVVNEMNHTTRTVAPPVSDAAIRGTLLRNNPFVHGSVMMRREVFDNVGPYDESFRYVQDYELWSRVAARYRLANLPEVLLTRRITRKSVWSDPKGMRRRAFLGLRAQARAIKRSRAPLYAYALLLKRGLRLLATSAPTLKTPIHEKRDLWHIFLDPFRRT